MPNPGDKVYFEQPTWKDGLTYGIIEEVLENNEVYVFFPEIESGGIWNLGDFDGVGA